MKNIIIQFLIILLFARAVVGGEETQDESQYTYAFQTDFAQKAIQLKNKGKYIEAKDMFDLLIQQTHQNRKEMQWMPQIQKQSILAYFYQSRAECLYHMDDLYNALKDYEEAYRLEPHIDRIYSIALCLYENGLYDRAIKKFNEFLESAEHSDELYYFARLHRAACFVKIQSFDEGVEELKLLKEDFSENRDELDLLIQKTLKQKEKWEKAIAVGNPLQAESLERLAKAEENPLIKAELMQKYEMYKESAEILSNLIDKAKPSGDVDKKGNFLVKTSPSQSISLDYLYFSRAHCWYQLERFDKALGDYTKSYQLNSDPDRLYDIGYCLYKLGHYDDAIASFDKYLAQADYKKEREFLTLYNRTFCVLETGQLDEGLSNLQDLKKRFPRWNDSVQYVIDQVLEKKKELYSSTNFVNHAK